MAGKNKKKTDKIVEAEYSVSMHCNACERSVAKAISKVKGVEKFTTDMRNHKVVVTGRIDPEKVLKKLRKKTGKRMELLVRDEDDKDEQTEGIEDKDSEEQVMDSWLVHYYGESENHLMFNDENANSCSIM